MTADMSPAAISARIRRAAALSELDADRPLHPKVDYAPEAVDARLHEVEALRRLCESLGRREPG